MRGSCGCGMTGVGLWEQGCGPGSLEERLLECECGNGVEKLVGWGCGKGVVIRLRLWQCRTKILNRRDTHT